MGYHSEIDLIGGLRAAQADVDPDDLDYGCPFCGAREHEEHRDDCDGDDDSSRP